MRLCSYKWEFVRKKKLNSTRQETKKRENLTVAKKTAGLWPCLKLLSLSIFISDSLLLCVGVCAWAVHMCVPVSNIPLLNGNESGSGKKPRPRLPAFSETGLTSQGLEYRLVQNVPLHTKLDTHTHTKRTYTKQNTKGTSPRVHFTWPFFWTKTDLRVRCLIKLRENSAWTAQRDKMKKMEDRES